MHSTTGTTSSTMKSSRSVAAPSASATSHSLLAMKVHSLESDGVCRYLFSYLLKMQRQLHALREKRASMQLSSSTKSGAVSHGQAKPVTIGRPTTATGSAGVPGGVSGDVDTSMSLVSAEVKGVSPFVAAPPSQRAGRTTPASMSASGRPTHRYHANAVGSSLDISMGLGSAPSGALIPAPVPLDQDDMGLPFLVGIPDTVIYEHNFPQAWFTYDVKTREISKKSATYLDVLEIHKGFSVVAENCGGVCAQFIGIRSSSKSHTTAPEMPPPDFDNSSVTAAATADTTLFSTTAPTAVADGGFHSGGSGGNGGETEVLYFTPDQLMVWLRDKDGVFGSKEGLLQRFVPPRGDRNDMLQFVWSPTASTLLRRCNVHPLHSMRADTTVKCPTFDGQPHMVEETKGNEALRRALEDVMRIISSNLLRWEHKVVSRMVLYVKRDREGRLWLLYAASTRVENDEVIGSCVIREPVDMDTRYAPIPSLCGDDVIAAALRLQTTMDPYRHTDRWHQFNTVHRDHSGSGRFSSRPHRRDTKVLLHSAEQWYKSSTGTTASSMPQELLQLSAFIEDTLYTLYAARMTTHRSVARSYDVVVALPQRLCEFLDHHGVEQLMVGVLGMEAVSLRGAVRGAVGAGPPSPTQAAVAEGVPEDAISPPNASLPLPGGSAMMFRLKGGSAKRPLSIVRAECETFLAEIKALYTTTS